MSLKNYQFFCDHCGYKRFTKGDDIQDLVQVKQAAIPGGTPYIDPITKKLTTPKSMSRPKTFKCPGCGYLIKATKITLVETIPDEQTNRIDGREAGPTGQSLPGELGV